ncbi:MAG: acyl-CoA dehydrogenase [Bacteroidia bacterium]|nr:acyl-CoA dehydrogenase [Bacteroidia bacterium]
MANKYFSLRNLQFLLKQVHEAETLTRHPYFGHFDWESMEMMIDAAKKLSETYLFPYYEDMDRNEPQLIDGKVYVHKSMAPFLAAMAEGGWLGATAPLEYGGMQIPTILGVAAGFIMNAANNGAMGFTGLTTGAANLILSFGTEEEKATYFMKMIEGKWQGTMALTEPQAGSSLSDITTTAYPAPDGTYRIKGQKIFISGGDYEGVENIVHMMLARIEGAPKGTKGISLFIVPKYRIEKGSLVWNDVTSAGVYHKMGQKGTPALHLMMGEKDDCHGYLLGQPNQGLSYMFQMMNEARILVGMGASAIASAAYYASLEYASERPQGRRLNDRNLENPQTLIINHPDVKRMLLLQKSVVEGGLSLIMQAAYYWDMTKVTEGKEKDDYELLLELLTPVVKTYPSEMGIVSVSNGLQILGGSGFCKDFPLENYYRDIRIYPLYEGTTGIQSLDLLGRKVIMNQGAAMKLFFAEIQKTIEGAQTFEELRKYAEILQEKQQKLQEITLRLAGIAMKGEIELFLSDATLYMELFGLVAVAWQWLKQATTARQAIMTENPQGDELEFYESKIHTMKFFFAYEVPKTLGLVQRLMDDEVLTIAMEKERAL